MITIEEDPSILSGITPTKTTKQPQIMVTKDLVKSSGPGGGDNVVRGGGDSLARGDDVSRGGGSLALGGGLSKNFMENQLEITPDLLAKLQNDGQVQSCLM